MVSAGIEGGCKARIENDWYLDDVHDIRSYWSKNGPPVNTSLVLIAQALGLNLLPKTVPGEHMPAPSSGLSISDLHKVASPSVTGNETLSASIEALKAMGMKP